MIYVTGDTHGQIDFYKLRVFAEEHPGLTKDDYVIIAGDFGGVWNSRTLDEDLAPPGSVQSAEKNVCTAADMVHAGQSAGR